MHRQGLGAHRDDQHRIGQLPYNQLDNTGKGKLHSIGAILSQTLLPRPAVSWVEICPVASCTMPTWLLPQQSISGMANVATAVTSMTTLQSRAQQHLVLFLML